MKNFLLFTAVILISIKSTAGTWTPLSSQAPSDVKISLKSSTLNENVLEMDLGGFYKKIVSTPQGDAYVIDAPSTEAILQTGAPDLSKATASIIIPDLADMKIEIISGNYVDFKNIEIAPSKGHLLRTVNPSTVPYTHGDVYNSDKFFPGLLADLQTPYIMRDFRGQAVWFYPFQYNPVSKTLRVYSKITVKVSVKNQPGINPFYRTQPLKTIDSEFAHIYKSHFKNGGNYVNYVPLTEGGEMLILCHGAWMNEMNSFIEWKARRGIHCEMVDIATIGNNTTAIQSYIASYYNSHNLKYVLIVGDVQYVTTPQLSGGASDPSYGYITGNDSYAEVIVGRFSAESAADVQSLVQRSIDYELNPTPLGTWYKKGVGLASNQGPGDDNEMDYEHVRNIRSNLMNFGFSDVDELYDGSQGGVDASGDPSASDLIDAINDGRSVINYTGHGSQNSCATTGFNSGNVSSLTNFNMLPYWWSVGCVHGFFDNGTCIAEVLTRSQSGGQPIGMVSVFMSSVNQYWNEPMEAQDEFDSIMTECYVNNIKRSFGGININGCYAMNDDYGPSGYDMTNTWHCFGDPSLMIRNNIPAAITASHITTSPVGTSQLVVTCNTNDAMITLTKGATIIASGIVQNNTVTLNFNPVSNIDTLMVTATGFNCIPYTGLVYIIPSAGPFVIYNQNTVNDLTGNNNGLPDYGESIVLDVELENVGITDATNVTATISTSDAFITVTNATANYGIISSGTKLNLTAAFAYDVASNINDQHPVIFDINIADGLGNNWQSQFTQLINAPMLQITTLTVNDATGNNNGILEPGETADIIINTSNNGHSASPNANGLLTSISPYITVNNGASSIGVINAQGNYSSTLNVSLNNNITLGSVFDLTFDVGASAYGVNQTFYLTAGEILEDFETNNFTKFNWYFGGNANWSTISTLPYQGIYCAKSGVIGNNQTSELLLDVTVLSDDSVSFYKKVSSETNYDYLRFYIDGVKADEWSGAVSWSYSSYSINGGTHTIKWAYEKDPGVASGQDAAWLDNIQLPPMVLSTGVNENADLSNILFYPNPVNDYAILNFNLEKPTTADIRIYNATGSLVKILGTGTEMKSGEQTLLFNTKEFNQGVYFVSIIFDGKTKSLKFIK